MPPEDLVPVPEASPAATAEEGLVVDLTDLAALDMADLLIVEPQEDGEAVALDALFAAEPATVITSGLAAVHIEHLSLPDEPAAEVLIGRGDLI